jgi:hypothetical protein
MLPSVMQRSRDGKPLSRLGSTKNSGFRIEGTKRLVAGVAPDKCTPAMGSLKPAQWHLGIDFVVQSQNLQCSCHAVEQIPSAGRGRTAQFVPIRFVFRNKLNRDDKLLLAFDARVLSGVVSRGGGPRQDRAWGAVFPAASPPAPQKEDHFPESVFFSPARL